MSEQQQLQQFSFNPLFSGLTLKVGHLIARLGVVEFQSPIFGADAQSQKALREQTAKSGFNPLFSGLTLKVDDFSRQMQNVRFQSPIFGADAQRIIH